MKLQGTVKGLAFSFSKSNLRQKILPTVLVAQAHFPINCLQITLTGKEVLITNFKLKRL